MIWILTGVMIFAFAGLLILQVQYVATIMKTSNELFDLTVRRSLEKVSRELSKDEVYRYAQEYNINNRYSEDAYSNSQAVNDISISIKYTSVGEIEQVELQETRKKTEMQKLGSASTTKSSIIDRSEMIQRSKAERYSYINAISEDMMLMLETDMRPIERRVNFLDIQSKIRNELVNNGLNIPFILMIVNNNEQLIFQSEPLPKNSSSADIITQVIFPFDLPSRHNYIKVYFPTKNYYISESVSFLVPSLIFSLILLLTFAITIYTIFRQKRISEIKNDFINNMTHELKTPVSTISIAAQMMKDSDITKSPEVFRNISNIIDDETKRLGFLVEKVLQMSLFEDQQASLKLKELDINDLIVNVANTFEIKVNSSGGNLDIDLQAEKSTILADEMHITNMLFNLMDNAVKYRRESVPLRLMVRTRNENSKLIIAVEDNGIGVKKESLKKIFERFYRVPKGNVHNVKGFGLGLAYVRKVAEDHHGSIRAENGLGNIGTTFIITLPTIQN